METCRHRALQAILLFALILPRILAEDGQLLNAKVTHASLHERSLKDAPAPPKDANLLFSTAVFNNAGSRQLYFSDFVSPDINFGRAFVPWYILPEAVIGTKPLAGWFQLSGCVSPTGRSYYLNLTWHGLDLHPDTAARNQRGSAAF